MKLSEAIHYLPLIQAAAEGKTLQTLVGDEWSTFTPDAITDFGSPPDYYRVKPEAREFWINVYGPEPKHWHVHHSPEAAKQGRTSLTGEVAAATVLHVREVIEGEE